MLYVTQYIYQYKVDEDQHLILNTLNGALDIVTDRLARLLKQKGPVSESDFTEEERSSLMERGYLLSESDEKERVATWFTDYKEHMKAFHFIVCPTFTCNLRCPYCYEDLEIRQGKTRMTPEQVDLMFAAMEKMVEERGATQVQMQLFGGEPFLRANKDLVSSIIERAASKGWGISGITNGTQIDSYLDVFDRLPEGRLTQIQITMDGPEEIHNELRIHADGRGSYTEISRNITKLLERNVPVMLRVNTGTNNVDHLPRLFQAFEDMGWTQSPYFICQVAPINDHGCTGCVPSYQPEFKLLHQLHALFEDWEAARDRYNLVLGYDLERRTELLREALYDKPTMIRNVLDLSGCSASKHHYVVFGADGNLYACPETVGIPEVAIGRFAPDFHVDTAKWNKWDLNISNNAKCRDCNIAPVCGGACPWHGFNNTSFDAYEPHCNFAQQSIKSYLDLNKPRILELIQIEV